MSTFTIEDLLEVKRKLDALGPPPEPVRLSRHATAEPSGVPRTEDMLAMVEDLQRRGQTQRVPCAYRIAGLGYVVHPDLLKTLPSD